jgi:cytochrome c-type biogenesis protein CcmH
MSAAPVTSGTQPAAPARASVRQMSVLGVVVLAFAAAGYWWTGTPDYDRRAAAAAPGDDHRQLETMVAQLAARLQSNPADSAGWAMLGRSYLVTGRHADAAAAFEKVIALKVEDARVYADYADALAMKAGRRLAGEPMKWVEKALALDPNQFKALALAGSAAFEQKDYAGAVRYWERLIAAQPGDEAFAAQVRAGIDEARQLGKLPPSTQPMAQAGASLQGTVALGPALAAQAKPDDTVFVFARAAEGPRMPLAILRKQVKDLPFEFRLDDAMAMSAGMKLSNFAKLVVVARVSKSGQAGAAPGDLTGESAAVEPGARGLRVEITEVVKTP